MRNIAVFTAAALALATGPAAFAATKPAPATVAAAKTDAAAAKTEKAARTAKVAAADAHKVTTKTSTGKTVTYDCSKAGNKTKAACKGKA